jgi:tetratricopeptide (TPR) repeat protein
MATASVVPSGGTGLLLEREVQVAALWALADAARSGGGRFVVIEGTAGIGKTRLLAEARTVAGSAGMRVLAARGGELEGEFAYGIVRQLFEPLLAVVSPELGLAERRTNGPAAADHLRAGLELLADPARRGEVALELGRALWFTDRISDALAVFERALGEVDRERDPDLYELLLAELISSAWWNTRTYPIAEAAIGELDLDALHGGLGSEILLATIAHYEYRLGLHRELAIELARRALASGNLLASGSPAFCYTVTVLPRSGVLDEVVPIFNQAIAQARRRGDIFNVAFMLTWRGHCQTRRGALRAAVADLREAIDLADTHGMLVARPYNVGFLAHALLE